MIRVVTLLTWIAINTSCYGQSNPFEKIDYDSLVGYNFALRDTRVQTILGKDRTLDKTTIFPGTKLRESQSKSLIRIITDTLTYGGASYACFEPKHAFIFYKHSSIVALVEICFACNNVRSTPAIPAVDYYAMKSDHQLSNYGFSNKGAKRLMDLCKKIGLEVPGIPTRAGD
jgi:hypothetical protein